MEIKGKIIRYIQYIKIIKIIRAESMAEVGENVEIDWSAVIVGFFLSIVLGALLGVIIPIVGSVLGLFLAGMVVGYMVGGDAVNGVVNGAVSGLFGAIILSILMLIFGTIFLGLIGFAAATVTSIILFIAFFGVMIIMAIGGVIGSLIKGKPENSFE